MYKGKRLTVDVLHVCNLGKDQRIGTRLNELPLYKYTGKKLRKA